MVLRGSLRKGAFLFVFRRAPIGAVVYTFAGAPWELLFIPRRGPMGAIVYTSQGPPSLGSLLFANKKAAEHSQLFYLENDKISERPPTF